MQRLLRSEIKLCATLTSMSIWKSMYRPTRSCIVHAQANRLVSSFINSTKAPHEIQCDGCVCCPHCPKSRNDSGTNGSQSSEPGYTCILLCVSVPCFSFDWRMKVNKTSRVYSLLRQRQFCFEY